MNLQPVLVTGGGGFIGHHLIRKLLDEGFEVEAIDRAPRPPEIPNSPHLSYYQADLKTIDSHSKNKPGTKIVHLAANTSVQQSVKRPIVTVRANVEATCRMLDFARKLDSSKFLFASTAAVYGDRTASCSERDSPAPTSPYAASKLASEYYCKVYSKLYGIPTVILRYFNIYGPGQSDRYAGVITRFVKEAMRGRPPIVFGDGKQTRDFIFVEDVVGATIEALTLELPGGTTINIGSGSTTSIISLAKHILRLFNLKQLQPVHVAPRIGEIRHSQANIELARKMIRFRPRYQLHRGLPPTIKWLRASVT
jgi:UDP-glucose 4-epimerase